jgi:hypothetical protein
MDAARLLVDVRHPQALPRRIFVGQAAREEGARCEEAVELEREFDTLMPHDAPTTHKRRRSPL